MMEFLFRKPLLRLIIEVVIYVPLKKYGNNNVDAEKYFLLERVREATPHVEQ